MALDFLDSCRFQVGAIQDYDKAIQLDPHSARTFHNRALANSQLGLHSKALEDYDRAIELDPNFEHAFCNRGAVRTASTEYEVKHLVIWEDFSSTHSYSSK